MSNDKKVGIITMHRVANYGSILQAFALQEFISSLGYNVELIDYVFPNRFHRKFIHKSFVYSIVRICFVYFRKVIYFFRYGGDQDLKAKKACRQYYHLSKKFHTPEDIKKNPPIYDIYVVGSDQVWNTDFTFGDDVFMCSFAPKNTKKISFASSCVKENIPKKYEFIFKDNLSSFSSISIRDKKCRSYLETLLNRNVKTVCDPVFLLPQTFYNEIAIKSKLNIKGEYILVYILDYMYNPYPEIVSLVTNIKNQMNLPVIAIWGKSKNAKMVNCDIFFPVPSLEDFLYLFKNASMILTSSFHGTAFSIIFKKQFYAIINTVNGNIRGGGGNDYRIIDLLDELELNERMVNYNSECIHIKQLYWQDKSFFVEKYISESKKYLKRNLESEE